ncbi:hypothetical protein [Phenylobacterium montanum]|uniref:Uncharacterized protein n=1 Tax=Phenylobacterium montanum TaxID=2823693 RepID=A0A975IWI1_9CAUL|nr:hypothetical protein [Caulobacter sp. S6]QUD89898.1 hypothetical protein KCG34_08550 [Caulobacter sp. S6]
MRLSTLSAVAAAMMLLIWMVAATWRPHGLYADTSAGAPGAMAAAGRP